mgnify:CR=1 FL=1
MGSEKNIIHQENQKDSTEVKLSMAKKIGYGLGEAGSTLSFTMISSYLTVFYSDVVGLAPAVTFFKPSATMACANTVAVVVPSPASSPVLEATSLTSCAPVFW